MGETGSSNRHAPPVVTIVMAVFNACLTLDQALASIRSQKLDGIELVVVDGGSTDGTQALLEQNLDVIDRFISERDTGIYNAWNKGLALARGDWLAFVGADDVYVAGALQAYLDAASRSQPGTELISSRVRYHPNFGKPFVIGRAWRWAEFQRHMTIAHVGALHRRKLYERLGRYDERYKICGDYELLLRARDSLQTEFFPTVTIDMGGDGVSNNQLHRVYRETCRAKWESGGRPRVSCEAERVWDHLRAKVKRALPRLGRR